MKRAQGIDALHSHIQALLPNDTPGTWAIQAATSIHDQASAPWQELVDDQLTLLREVEEWVDRKQRIVERPSTPHARIVRSAPTEETPQLSPPDYSSPSDCGLPVSVVVR